MKESGKQSIKLEHNILSVFSNISNFAEFHHFIIQYHVDEIIFQILEYENQRFKMIVKDLKKTSEDDSKKEEIRQHQKKAVKLLRRQEQLLTGIMNLLFNE